MRLYVDDVRNTPVGFDVRTYSYTDTIDLLSKGNITHISLDHDLEPEHYEGKSDGMTGYDIACWIETQARLGTLPRMTWAVHSMNPSGASRIRVAMAQADYWWQSHEFNRG